MTIHNIIVRECIYDIFSLPLFEKWVTESCASTFLEDFHQFREFFQKWEDRQKGGDKEQNDFKTYQGQASDLKNSYNNFLNWYAEYVESTKQDKIRPEIHPKPQNPDLEKLAIIADIVTKRLKKDEDKKFTEDSNQKFDWNKAEKLKRAI